MKQFVNHLKKVQFIFQLDLLIEFLYFFIEDNDQEVVSSDYQIEIFTETFELEKLDLNSRQHNGYEIKGIQLVGLEWNKFKKALLFSLFLLLTAFIKIVYNHIHFLNHTLPESWYVKIT